MNLLTELRKISKDHKLNSDLKLKIKLKDGRIKEGRYDSYSSACDNDPEIPSILISKEKFYIELFENEIDSIEVM